ncbi:hypothetical protein HMPREF9999_00888 [Alloprevotella sp. oral taxon 473 str. F0040]|nr:hypothetical protein HMPREF9999_00888 [Alloprevotella sp. oral taxon 473 str. F0040]
MYSKIPHLGGLFGRMSLLTSSFLEGLQKKSSISFASFFFSA